MLAHVALALAALDLIIVLGLVALSLTAPAVDEDGDDVTNQDGGGR
jgi:hypothetical protein